MRVILSSETSVDFNGIHHVISQKKEVFISTAVRRTSNPTKERRHSIIAPYEYNLIAAS
jgi:hypothetical protein